MTIVDANVVVKWFVRETDWEVAGQVGLAGRLSAPSHLVVEVGRALLRSMRNDLITHANAATALNNLPTAVDLIPSERLISAAFGIAASSSITIYDALYVAAAVQEDTRLVTADARLVNGLKISAWRDRAILVGDWVALQRIER